MNPKFPVLAVLLFALSLPLAAQDKGVWFPSSQTATSITGQMTIGDSKISMDYMSWPLAPIRALTPVEISAVFDADSNVAQAGNLYRLNIDARQKFLHKNTLCGTEQTQWMATYVENRNLHVAFFSGANMPVFTFDAIRNSPDLCGTFLYTR